MIVQEYKTPFCSNNKCMGLTIYLRISQQPFGVNILVFFLFYYIIPYKKKLHLSITFLFNHFILFLVLDYFIRISSGCFIYTSPSLESLKRKVPTSGWKLECPIWGLNRWWIRTLLLLAYKLPFIFSLWKKEYIYPLPPPCWTALSSEKILDLW